jgi:hypothetical protein
LVETEQPASKERTGQGSAVQGPAEASAARAVAARPSPKVNTSPVHGLWALTERDLRKWYTNPYQLIISLIQPIIWMGLFGKALNFSSFITAGAPAGVNANAIMLSFFGTTSYFSFLVCGMLIFIVLFSSTFAGMSVVWDRRFGFMNKALSTPVSRGTIVMGKILQSVGRSLIQAVVVLLIGVALGMDTSKISVVGLAGTFSVIFLVAMGLSGLFGEPGQLRHRRDSATPDRGDGHVRALGGLHRGPGVRRLLLYHRDSDVVETPEQVAPRKIFIANAPKWPGESAEA